MTRRYSERISVRCPVVFSMGSMVGDGEVQDLSNPGCQIQSTACVLKGECLQLKMLLPGVKSPLAVALGVVRWTNGSHFGVEFIKMHADDRALLTRFISERIETCSSGNSHGHKAGERGPSWHSPMIGRQG
jgi:PilZ domain-containing protein